MNSGTITEVGDDYLKGTMPADKRTFQPYGVVHGGANVVLAETLGSLAGAFTIDLEKYCSGANRQCVFMGRFRASVSSALFQSCRCRYAIFSSYPISIS